jgi:ABC-type uncharacterized transport system permease subunit
MNRRAINLAFPLLTAGLLIGWALVVQRRSEGFAAILDPKILGTGFLWLVFTVLLYLRYKCHVRGRPMALMTIVAFVLLLVTLASEHTSLPGGVP